MSLASTCVTLLLLIIAYVGSVDVDHVSMLFNIPQDPRSSDHSSNPQCDKEKLINTPNRTNTATHIPISSTALSVVDNNDNLITHTGNVCGKCQRHRVRCTELVNLDLNLDLVGNVDQSIYDVMNVASGLPHSSMKIISTDYLANEVLRPDVNIKNIFEPADCTLVVFYAEWCPWCARAAPYLNAAPRAFKNIRFAAVDTSQRATILTTLGVFSVPTILLFHNGRFSARYNNGSVDMSSISAFLEKYTDQQAGTTKLRSVDYRGPLSSVPQNHLSSGILLYSAWIFIIATLVVYLIKKLDYTFDFVIKLWMIAQELMEDEEFHLQKFPNKL